MHHREKVSKHARGSFLDFVYVPMPIVRNVKPLHSLAPAPKLFSSKLITCQDYAKMIGEGKNAGDKRSVNSLVSCLPKSTNKINIKHLLRGLERCNEHLAEPVEYVSIPFLRNETS